MKKMKISNSLRFNSYLTNKYGNDNYKINKFGFKPSYYTKKSTKKYKVCDLEGKCLQVS
uniref:Uncharacterized protein n=1 Tax=viral metagenome TaxID=1070528 RepID=A0A6C0KY80_9ZZZZ